MDEKEFMNLFEKIYDDLFVELVEKDLKDKKPSHQDLVQQEQLLKKIKADPRYIRSQRKWYKLMIPLFAAAAALVIFVIPEGEHAHKGSHDKHASLQAKVEGPDTYLKIHGEEESYFAVIAFDQDTATELIDGFLREGEEFSVKLDTASVKNRRLCLVMAATESSLKFVIEQANKLRDGLDQDRCVEIP